MGTKEAKKRAKEKMKKDSDSDISDSEHELSYYINDRIKLMQQVLGLIKPKKIISMAPDSMKDMQSSAIKSLLLEELLGISNKRLRHILAGENLDDDTSSDSQIDKDESAEVISLDDITDGSEIYISDDNNCMEIQLSEQERLELEKENANNKKTKRNLIDKNKNGKEIVVKKENEKKRKKHKKKSSIKEEKIDNNDEPVVNVLNLLELQARARAIRSQLASEILSNTDASKTKDNLLIDINDIKKSKSDDDSDSVICVSPQNTPVVMIQSNSEGEDNGTLKSNLENIQKESATNKEQESSHENNEKNHQEKNDEDNSSPININSNDEDYNNDVLIVTEDDITLDKDSLNTSKEKVKTLDNNAEDDDSCTWKSRWLESKKVKDVMKTTKLYNSLRQKRKQKRTDSEEHDTDIPETIDENKDNTSLNEVEEVSESSKPEEAIALEDKSLPVQEILEIEHLETI